LQKHIKMDLKKDQEERRAKLVDLLINKAALKQDIADYSEKVLGRFKNVVQEELKALGQHVNDRRIRLKYKNKGRFEFRVFIGSDALVFQLHTNIFRFPDEDAIWESEYLTENGANGYFATINIYNFLAESVEKGRSNDAGYLIGRLFLNHEEHFIVEGKGQLGSLFRDLENSELTDDVISQVIHAGLSFAVDFDLITPPYDMVQEVSLMQINAISSDLQVATGKRLGFKFKAEDKEII
tara:strand:- start:55 stop:771 length:717 start_codon:yes stop_codon:yes gene_type:complete